MTHQTKAIPVEGALFEDIIDGYFPLQESLRQMLRRNGFTSACVTLTHVPIMHIPGLAPDAPVPLRLTKGTAGIADRLDIVVTVEGQEPRLSGTGTWRWYSGEKAQERHLSAHTRLAEPAIVHGVGLSLGSTQTRTFGRVTVQQNSDFVIHQGPPPDLHIMPDARLWATSAVSGAIQAKGDVPQGLFYTPACDVGRGLTPGHDTESPGAEGAEILVYSTSATSCVG